MTAPPSPDRTPLPRPHPDVVLAEVTEGAVLYLSEREHYFGLNPVALVVWRLLPESETSGALLDALTVRFPDVPFETLRADVDELLEAFVRLGLVSPARDGTA